MSVNKVCTHHIIIYLLSILFYVQILNFYLKIIIVHLSRQFRYETSLYSFSLKTRSVVIYLFLRSILWFR